MQSRPNVAFPTPRPTKASPVPTAPGPFGVVLAHRSVWQVAEKWKTRPRGTAASSFPRGQMTPGLLGAVAIAFAHMMVHYVHGETGPLRHQHASKHAKLMLLRLVEAVVKGLGGGGGLLDVCRALRQTVGHRFKMVDGRHLFALRARLHHLPHGVHARLGGVLDRRLEGTPKLLLIGGQPKPGLHASELGVQNRLSVGRPLLHALRA